MTIHPWHHDIEEHEVHGPFGKHCNSLDPVLRGQHGLIAQPPQSAREQITIILVIIDDENHRQRLIHVFDFALSRTSIRSSRRGKSIGFATKSLHPAASARARSCGMAWAESAIMGTAAVSGAARNCRVTSQPSMTGSPRSTRIRAGARLLACARPSAPSWAMRT